MNVRSAVLAATLILGSPLAMVPVAVAQSVAVWPIPAVVSANAVPVTFSPDGSGAVLGMLSNGDAVFVLGPVHQQEGAVYVPVRTGSGVVGFVPLAFLSPSQPVPSFSASAPPVTAVQSVPEARTAIPIPEVSVSVKQADPIEVEDERIPVQPKKKRQAKGGGADTAQAVPRADQTDPQQVQTTGTVSDSPGSREAPLTIGTWAEIGSGWTAAVVDVTPNATRKVLAENSFNEDPEPGHQFFMVRIEARFDGEGSATIPAGNAFVLLGSSNVTYQSFDPGCGVIPDEFDDMTEVFSGGTLAGNLCFSVPSNEVGSFVLVGEDFWSFDDRRIWFAVQ